MARAKDTRGRKLKLTRPLIKKVKEGLSKGYPNSIAAIAAGISEATFYSWINIAKELNEIEDDSYEFDAEELLFIEFLEAVESGSATYKTVLIDRWLQATEPLIDENGNVIKQPDWRAIESFLKRRDPENFADVSRSEVKQSIEIEGENNTGVMVIPAAASSDPDDFAARLQQSQAQTHAKADALVNNNDKE